jgi:hypothetical protein
MNQVGNFDSLLWTFDGGLPTFDYKLFYPFEVVEKGSFSFEVLSDDIFVFEIINSYYNQIPFVLMGETVLMEDTVMADFTYEKVEYEGVFSFEVLNKDVFVCEVLNPGYYETDYKFDIGRANSFDADYWLFDSVDSFTFDYDDYIGFSNELWTFDNNEPTFDALNEVYLWDFSKAIPTFDLIGERVEFNKITFNLE